MEIHHERTSITILSLPSFGIYTESMIEGVNKIVGKGVITSTTKVSVYEGTIYADVLEDGVILIAGPKLEEKAGV